MKKLTMSVAAVFAVIAMLFSMSACGASPEDKMKNYIESESFQSQLDTMKSSFESMMDIDVKADGSKLVYSFTYKTQLDDSVLDTMKSSLESGMESTASTFEGIAKTMQDEIGVKDAAVVVQYNNADGKEIYSKEFSAK